jgi:hypothetical protein
MEQSPLVAPPCFQHDVYLKTTPLQRSGDYECVRALSVHLQASFNYLPDLKSPGFVNPRTIITPKVPLEGTILEGTCVTLTVPFCVSSPRVDHAYASTKHRLSP